MNAENADKNYFGHFFQKICVYQRPKKQSVRWLENLHSSAFIMARDKTTYLESDSETSLQKQ